MATTGTLSLTTILRKTLLISWKIWKVIGSYVAYFEDTEENEQKAKRFADIIISLIENEGIYKILQEKGAEIEWD